MKLHIASVLLLFAALLLLPTKPLQADGGDEDWQEPKRIRSMLVLPRVSRSGRAPVFMDAVEHRLVHGTWKTPKAGEEIGLPDGPKGKWIEIQADEQGWFQHKALQGGYGFATVHSDKERVVLLNARGHRHVYVNGVPRTGDVYNAGITRIAILLRKGTNELLFKGGRGRIQATLDAQKPHDTPVFFEKKDRTLPDVVVGEKGEELWAGVIVTNATTQRRQFQITTTPAREMESVFPPLSLPPLTSRKFAILLPPGLDDTGESVDVTLTLSEGEQIFDNTQLKLRVRRPDQHHRRTFTSRIDGSVQYYGVAPRTGGGPYETKPALFLSLHGASVQGMRQASCYQTKDWGVVIAPTNRRPFGFDWEDWGRIDALEVLALARKRFDTDPRRTYLTGHSMGGHGTWSIAAHLPGRFAAIAPSAGWRDFWSYGGGVTWKEPTPVQAMLDRAANVSRTLLMEDNYIQHGIYILHGDKDDNVPVGQARFMRERLAKFHPNWAYYEQPGAGHWWGNRCMDWPPLFEFLKQNVLPESHTLTKLKFTTISPGINSRCHWLSILRQVKPLEPSTLDANLAPKKRLFRLEVTNVAQLELDLAAFAKPRTVMRKDKEEHATVLAAGQPIRIKVGDAEPFEMPWPSDGIVNLERGKDGAFVPAKRLAPWYKNARRYGTFKDAFRNNVAFVYGTKGSKEQTEWAFNKARYDAETFWYRGNGAVEIVRDTDFDPLSNADRNVILYGNQATNSAWSQVLDGRNFKVTNGKLEVGGKKTFEGDDMALLFVYPRKGSDIASVGVVGGTGIKGMRLTNQIPYFLSGAGFPDWIVYGAEMTELGSLGVRGAGFFDDDWALRDDAAWRDK